MCHVRLQVSVKVCVYTCVMLVCQCMSKFVCIHMSCWFTGVSGGLCGYMCHVGLLVSVEVCVGTCVTLVYRYVEVCVHVSCWFSGVCGSLCVYTCVMLV